MTIAIENFRVNAALAYAARGWRVFPLHHPKTVGESPRCSCGDAACGSVGKHPRTVNGLKNATCDPIDIRAWWQDWPGANIGICTGADSGIYAVDIDPAKGGDASWSELVSTYGETPFTPTVETGGGGQHLFFIHPGGKLGNTADKLGPGLDTRGDGGYVVAAPSLHQSGSRYSWRVSPEEATLAPLPPWLLAMLRDAPKPLAPRPTDRRSDDGTYWLGKALAKANFGNRNDTGYWLACQLRDARMSESEAGSVMRDYAERAPRGETPYTAREADASLRSAYAAPARDPAKNLSVPAPANRQPPKVVDPPPAGASAELRTFLGDVIDGKVVSVPFPWPLLTSLTQALIPGTTTVLVGDPGVGKTYFVLQCLLHWLANGIRPAVYFIEKDRRFHMMRLLAQLEGESTYLDYLWIRANGAQVRHAMARHASVIDAVGKHVYSSNGTRVTLDGLLGWIRQIASAGHRVIVVDPITAVDAGVDRWTKDDDFVLAAEHTATAHGASLLFITHAKKGNRPNAPSGHDAAGGAAWFRFCDTLVWMAKPKKPRHVRILLPGGGNTTLTPPIFYELHKTRHGKGSGQELAYTFGDGLKFGEQGMVLEDIKRSNLSQELADAG